MSGSGALHKEGSRSLGAGLSMRANVSWSFAGSLLHAGCRWLSLVVLARAGGAETVGTLALAIAIATPLFMLSNLQLREIQTTDAGGRFSFETVWGIRLLTTALALCVVCGILLFGEEGASLGPVLFFVSLSLGFESLSDAIYGRLQRRERLDRVARSMGVRGVLTLAFLGVGFWATGSLAWAAGAMAAASLLPLLLLDLPALRGAGAAEGRAPLLPRARLRRDELAPLLRSALPLGGTMMLVSLSSNLPRYFIDGALGRAETGVFAALFQLVSVGNLVVSAAAQAASPRLANLAHGGDLRGFRDLSRKLYLLVGALGFGGILLSHALGEPILGLVFGEEFAASADVLVLLAVGGSLGFACAVPGYGLTAVGAHGVQFPLFLVIVGVGAGLHAWLIPAFGLHGAAYALMLGFALQFVASRWVLERRLRKSMEGER